MRLIRHLPLVIISASLMLLASCTKTDMYTAGDSLSQANSSDAVSDVDLSNCKMRRIYQEHAGGVVSALFSYNSAGNPFSLLYSSNGTGLPNHYFFYDKQNRLREYRKTYNEGTTVVERHRYGYNASNQIVKDTVYYVEGDTIMNVSTLEYDAKGRIVKETIRNVKNAGAPLEKTRYPTFTYDNRGNIGVSGWPSSRYDYKINPLRQNPIFQFLMRNYSQNNAAPQAKYNSKGLPLSMNPTNDVFFNSSLTYKIVYDCQ